jgi:hypothetical protein
MHGVEEQWHAAMAHGNFMSGGRVAWGSAMARRAIEIGLPVGSAYEVMRFALERCGAREPYVSAARAVDSLRYMLANAAK